MKNILNLVVVYKVLINPGSDDIHFHKQLDNVEYVIILTTDISQDLKSLLKRVGEWFISQFGFITHPFPFTVSMCSSISNPLVLLFLSVQFLYIQFLCIQFLQRNQGSIFQHIFTDQFRKVFTHSSE